MSLADTTKQLNKVLQRCINTTLNGILGEAGKETILYHIGKDNTETPEQFSNALRRVLGLGAEVLERCILTNFYESLELPFAEKVGYDFVRYIEEAK